MNQSQTWALLLQDALDQIVVNPTASHRWHRLMGFFNEANDDTRAWVRQRVTRETPMEGVAGFLRATFLAGWTGDPAYDAQAAQIVQAIEPMDAGRLASFVALSWGRAVKATSDRAGFVHKLRHARLHEITTRLGQQLSSTGAAPFVRRDPGNLGKVALVVPYLSNADHTPTALALNQARLLVEQGVTVHLFASQELRTPEMAQYTGDRSEVFISPPDIESLRETIPAGLDVTFSDERFSLTRRWTDMLDSIAAFDPDLVMFVGMFSPLVTPLYQVRPVLGLCVHSVPPIAPVDVWLTANRELSSQGSSTWAPDLPEAWGFYHPYRIALKPIGAPLARVDIGVADDACVLVTAGHRLPDEINGEWADRMIEVLRLNPDVAWLLVGGSGTVPDALKHAPASQLHVLPNHADLRSVYRCCDIYVNPPRMGGGFSVAEAMAEGLPVLAFGDSDGGQKIGTASVSGEAEYFSRLHALIGDAGLRERTGAAMQAHFGKTHDIAQSGPSLLAACELTIARFQQRVSQSSS